MISVGSRDGRKGIGLGFDVRREMMEESELEEGEACSFHDDDPSVDPDIALSYIDEKIHDVLGHFQKDFEGGVSAENLGAKFGGYGSFLPTYQRSPIRNHPRSPPRAQNYNPPSSPNNLLMEGCQPSSAAPPSAPLKKPELSSSSAMVLPVVMIPFANDFIKSDVCKSSTLPAQDFPSKYSHADQKTLKVRIKVGSDNLSTQKKAEIYSGLGLDISPSSSLDESPAESEDFFFMPQAPEESPTSILQMIMSFPVCGDVLLSPLPDNLLCLTENKNSLRDNRSWPLSKDTHTRSMSNLIGNGIVSVKGDEKVLQNKKEQSVERNGFLVELGGVKREVDFDSLGCEEMISHTTKLPIMENSNSSCGVTEKCAIKEFDMARAASKGVMKDKSFSGIKKEKLLEPVPIQVALANKPNRKVALTGQAWEDIQPNSLNDASVCIRKDCNNKAEITDDIIKADPNALKFAKDPNSEALDPPKQKASKQVISREQGSMELPIWKEFSSSDAKSTDAKKKSKGGQINSHPVADIPKEGGRTDPSLVPKKKKGTHADNFGPKHEVGATKIQKDIGNASDRYIEFFGDMPLEEDENGMDSLQMTSSLVDSEVGEKFTSLFNSGSNDRLGSKKLMKRSKLGSVPKQALNVASLSGKGPNSDSDPFSGNETNFDRTSFNRNGPKSDSVPLSRNVLNSDVACSSRNGLNFDVAHPGRNEPIPDAPPAVVAPVVAEDNWVGCDKCQKWRLLPMGMNPDDLPEKWVCSMLNWLPGMNRCSVSEVETTNALITRNQIPIIESQNHLHGNDDTMISTVTLVDAQHQNQNHQNHRVHFVPTGGKKRHGLKELSDTTDQDGPTQISNPTKKSSHASMKSKSIYNVNQLTSTNDLGCQQSIKSSLHGGKHRNKHKVLKQSSDGGNIKKITMKSRREIDHECYRVIKKSKMEGMLGPGEDQVSNHVMEMDPCSSNGLPSHAAIRHQPKHKVHSSSKALKHDVKDESHFSVRKLKKDVHVSMGDKSVDKGQPQSRELVKKRKVKDSHDNETHMGSLPGTGHLLHESNGFVEEFSENVKEKEWKAKVPKCDGLESNGINVSGRKEKKRGSMDQLVLSQQIFKGKDPSTKDLGSVRPSVTVTSSSSKVSGSHKTKANFQELKGSPVESVSSAPLRILNPDKPRIGNAVGRDGNWGGKFLANASPRRFSDGEGDDRGHQSGRAWKEKIANANQYRPLESSLFDCQDRDFSQLTDSKAIQQARHSPELERHNLLNSSGDNLGNDTRYSIEPQAINQLHNEGIKHENHCHNNGYWPRKTAKASSLQSKDSDSCYKSEFDNGKIKIADSSNDFQDHVHCNQDKTRDRKHKAQEKKGSKYDKGDKKSVGKKGKSYFEISKTDTQLDFEGQDGPDIKIDGICSQNTIFTSNPNQQQDHDGERSLQKSNSDKNDKAGTISGRGNSLLLPLSRGGNDNMVVEKHHRKVDNHSETQHMNSRQSIPSGHRGRDLDTRSPGRRDCSSQAANSALKEAKNLKHMADRLKNSGSNREATGLYFQASLKFLHAASLLESCNTELSLSTYGSTAKVCQYCAHEYERVKDMAAAALAYKCAEVAYMRVIYSSHNIANKDRQELQIALQMVPPGESPSSSASDVDNLNNPLTCDKVALAKWLGSPQVAGNHVIAAQNQPNFLRLLSFAQDVNFAMEASRKSQIAFAAANVRLEDAKYKEEEDMSSIAMALNFSFQDVEGLLHLVRLAMEAISRG